jgi:hypothetical protein
MMLTGGIDAADGKNTFGPGARGLSPDGAAGTEAREVGGVARATGGPAVVGQAAA